MDLIVERNTFTIARNRSTVTIPNPHRDEKIGVKLQLIIHKEQD